MLRLLALVPPLLAAGCAASWSDDYDRLTSDLETIHVRHERALPGPSTDAAIDADLGETLDLGTLLRLALARNPDLREASARARAGLEAVGVAGSLDAPTLSFESEGIPFGSAASPGKAMDNKLGISQSLPFPGTLSIRAEASLREAEGLRENYREREREVVAQVKRAYIEIYMHQKELEIHREHVALLEEFEKASEVRFRNGAVSQQDVLRPQVEQVMLHNEVYTMQQRLGTALAALNRLLHRPAGAPLGRVRDLVAPDETFDVLGLTAKALSERPEVRAAEHRLEASRAALKAAGRDATWPDLGLGVEYMQFPDAPDGYSAMFSISLPWFTGKKAAEARRWEQASHADEFAAESVRSRVQFEVRDAWLRVESARKSLALFKGELLPKSTQSLEVSRAGYEKDKASFLDLLDSERSLRDVSLRHTQALAQYETAVADLERAVGADLRRTP